MSEYEGYPKQRQAVMTELRWQWYAMAGPQQQQQEAEDPKYYIRHVAPPKPLKDGEYTVYVEFSEKEIYLDAYVENGWLYFTDAPYALGEHIGALLPNGMENDAFHSEVGKYTSPIEDAATKGRTSGSADGIGGPATFRLTYVMPLQQFDELGNEIPPEDDHMAEAICVVENLLNESPRLPTLKARRRSLTPEEKRDAGDAPIWKATVNGQTWYVCNTHRCYQARSTVKDAVHAWNNGVKQSG